jgi:Holliday junction DNA helicase RuvB
MTYHHGGSTLASAATSAGGMIGYRMARQWDLNARRRRPPRPAFDTSGYPATLGEYIGQPLAKRQLAVSVTAARARRTPLRHVLITSGVAGQGKTALAVAGAGELGVKMQVLSGQVSATDAMDALAGLDDGDVLFIDELHRLVQGGKGKAEWILHLLADGQIIDGQGVHPMPDVTVIGATTDAGRLPKTITTRFDIVCQLEPYSVEDARAILVAEVMGRWPLDVPLVDTDVLDRIVDAGNRNPRSMKALLATVLDGAVVEQAGGQPLPFEDVLAFAGLTADGLDRLAQRMLLVLASEFGGTAGERPLMNRLQEPGGLRYAEHVLQEKGLLTMSPQGRCLTQDGWHRAAGLAAEGVEV